jgi:hypothetical protein
LNALNDLRRVPKLSLKRKLDNENSSEQSTSTSNAKIVPEIRQTSKIEQVYYTCGNCKAVVPILYWKKHFNFHNGIAWRDTVDPPIDMLNLRMLCSLMEMHNETNHFKCENCPETKFTALDLLLHMEYCGLTDDRKKEECIRCKIKLMPYSFQDHIFRNMCSIETDGGTLIDSSDDDLPIASFHINKSQFFLTKRTR